ncbi:MAG: hypothetical protein JWP97_4549 [Labilithrix sp.]|nr:hypothetical protein [Labilithrix sp.]
MLEAMPLRLTGWEFEGPVPPEKKCVVLAVPHTSNWDAPLLVSLAGSVRYEMSWMIKDDWFKGPMGPLLRSVGGLPVNRRGSHKLVDQMVRRFAEVDSLHLVIPPEGTRKRTETWRSGFYHIARGANVPLVLGWLDYGRKRGGLGAAIDLTGDVKKDMDRIRAFYAEKNPRPRWPAKFGPIALKEETVTG